MFRFCFFLLCAVLCASCSKKYKIEGSSSVSTLDGKMLFIKVPTGDNLIDIDSAEIIHGLFKMKGKVDSTVFTMLYMDDKKIIPIVLEQGNISIRIDNARITIKGTPLNDSFNNFILSQNSLDDRASEVEYEESRMIMDGTYGPQEQHEIVRKRNQLQEERNNLIKNFIQDNYENALGPGIFFWIGSNMPFPSLTPTMEEIVEKAPDSFKNNPMVKDYVSAARSNMEKMGIIH